MHAVEYYIILKILEGFVNPKEWWSLIETACSIVVSKHRI
jgi:hypothetical protein